MKRTLAILLLAAGCGAPPPASWSFPPVEQLPERKDPPDPLVMMDGRKVATAEQWLKERRYELKHLLQHYMYGFFKPTTKVEALVRRTDPKALGGKATLKEISLTVGPPHAPKIELLLVVPNRRSGVAPVVLGLNFNGNHALIADPDVALPKGWMRDRGPGVVQNRATDAGRGKELPTWSLEASIDRGYAIATFCSSDVDPDRHDWSDGIHPVYYAPGQTKPGPHEWGTLAAWAWGLHRAVDYLVTDPDIDPARIACFGHSRNGKTALLATAFDDRIALAIPHQAGCGGTAPSRTKNPKAETVKRINAGFPHWFNDEFTKFDDQVDRLPFDQHCLLALVAPRPVLYSNAQEDQWADPGGQFEMLKAADPVWRLLRAEGLGADRMPEEGKLLDSRLGFFIRAGKHSTTPEDWKIFLDFCDKHLKR